MSVTTKPTAVECNRTRGPNRGRRGSPISRRCQDGRANPLPRLAAVKEWVVGPTSDGETAVPAFRSSGVGSMIRTSHPSGPRRKGRSRSAQAPDAHGVPETLRSSERVSNWKEHRTLWLAGRWPASNPVWLTRSPQNHTSARPGRCGLQSGLVVVSQPHWMADRTDQAFKQRLVSDRRAAGRAEHEKRRGPACERSP